MPCVVRGVSRVLSSTFHPELSGPSGKGNETRNVAFFQEEAEAGSGLGCQRAFQGRPQGIPEQCHGRVFL